VQPAVALVRRKDAAFAEQFPRGGQVGGSNQFRGASFFLAVAGSSRFGPRIRTIHAHVLTGQRLMGGQCFINAIRLTIQVGIVSDREDAAVASRSHVNTGVVAPWFHVIHVIGGIRVIRTIRISNVRFKSRAECGTCDTFRGAG